MAWQGRLKRRNSSNESFNHDLRIIKIKSRNKNL